MALAGLVRGFSGFGSAMIALPLGIAVLTRWPVIPFGWVVSVTVLILLAVLTLPVFD